VHTPDGVRKVRHSITQEKKKTTQGKYLVTVKTKSRERKAQPKKNWGEKFDRRPYREQGDQTRMKDVERGGVPRKTIQYKTHGGGKKRRAEDSTIKSPPVGWGKKKKCF